MNNNGGHPIESAKGSSAVSFGLAAIGAFLPFLPEILYAQILAVVLVLLIFWLYWSDFKRAKSDGLGFSHFIAPTISSVSIVLVAAYATCISSTESQRPSTASPSLNAEQVVRNEQPPTRPAETIVKERNAHKGGIYSKNKSYPRASTAQDLDGRDNHIKDSNAGITEELKKIAARAIAGQDEYRLCMDKQINVGIGLFGLDRSGYEIQNQWAYTRDSKKFKSSYDKWNEDIKSFFRDNESYLPDYSIVELANYDEESKTFLGIGGDTSKIMGRLNAKRKVIQSIAKDKNRGDCENVRKAAVLECIEKRQC
jgi:hypothetical protein